MPLAQDTRTNAGDSAPGVDDGRAGAPPPLVNSRPRGRGVVWLVVAASLLLLLVVAIARPAGERGAGDMVATGTTSGEVETPAQAP